MRRIKHTAESEGKKPIVFTTLVNMEVLQVITEGYKGHCMLLDMFGTFVNPLEVKLLGFDLRVTDHTPQAFFNQSPQCRLAALRQFFGRLEKRVRHFDGGFYKATHILNMGVL